MMIDLRADASERGCERLERAKGVQESERMSVTPIDP